MSNNRKLPESSFFSFHSSFFPCISEVDIKAAEMMGELHDALKENKYTGHDLEMYLVRLLFCLFADDTGINKRKVKREE